MAALLLISVLALLQFMAFGLLVSRARGRYGVQAPATSGHEIFDRYFRVQMNTLELLVVFIPALWISSLFVKPVWLAPLGLIYLIGRQVYLYGYVRAPARRHIGFLLSTTPIIVLLIIDLVGSIFRR